MVDGFLAEGEPVQNQEPATLPSSRRTKELKIAESIVVMVG
jgi:hypothetical protein